MEGLSTVTWNARTFYARSALAAGQPSSSVTRLIQGIWETETAQARAILRKRIHTTEQLTPMNWGMVKTAAQRISVVPAVEPHDDWQPVAFDNPFRIMEVSGDAMTAARALAGNARRDGELFRRDRPVGCVLVAAGGELLGGAFNTNRDNRTLHAEVNLLQALGCLVPAGATLYTTLEPCRMCQGMIVSCAPGLKVRYAESDAVPEVPWTLDCRPY